MVDELRKAIEVGALGWSFTKSGSHSDGDGQPVPSRWATDEEMLALATETGRHEGTTLEGIVAGCLDRFADDEIELLGDLSAAANRPLNWNVLTVDSREPDRVPRQLSAYDSARAKGGRVVALTLPVLVPMNMNFLTFCGIWLLPGWQEALSVPVAERIARLKDPEVRAQLLAASQSQEAGVYRRLADWDEYVIGDTFSPANEGLSNRIVKDIAAERGTEPFDTLLDIVVADELRTVLWPAPKDKTDDDWAMRTEVWNDPRAMIGGSDAGAHLDRMCGATYPTRFLGDMIRGRKLIPVEKAVHLMTQVPAELLRPARPRRPRRGPPRRHRGHRPRDRRLRERPHGRRPARRLRAPHRRLVRRRAGAGQRHRRHRRRPGHRRHPGHPAQVGRRHLHRRALSRRRRRRDTDHRRRPVVAVPTQMPPGTTGRHSSFPHRGQADSPAARPDLDAHVGVLEPFG